MSRCEEIIAKYDLIPHPEGGWYKETYRCTTTVPSPVNGQTRNSVTQIYFLLTEGDISRFHKVAHDEIWHFYEGAPLRLLDLHNNQCNEIFLGRDNGHYHHVIPGGHYQAAESTGKFTLVGCTVAPGFDFNDFQFLQDDEAVLQAFETHSENYRCFI
ncbi:cupin domain-containing protein [Planctobacterium marinum]|uniref:DUF985 domain-containing protein n=1 Tax=Planctobacterium marinum TaxID=1631968 RepID=A0AA48HJE5_9ALTE|nr:hypothetical protein MACH26_34940 [Planctobacterium marinum]